MRILHVIPWLAPRYGGPTRVVQDLCRQLALRGHEIEIYTSDSDGDQVWRGPVPVMENLRVAVFRTGYPRRYVVSWQMLRSLLANVQTFDLVHIHGIYRFPCLAAALACQIKKKPYIIRPHGTLDRYHRGVRSGRKKIYEAVLGKRVVRRAAAFHFVSRNERDQAREAGFHGNSFIAAPGIEVSRFLDPKPDGNSTGRLVLFLGRLAEKKGIELLIEAMSSVVRSFDKVKLVVAGPDDERRRPVLENLAKSLGLQQTISFPGLVEGETKQKLLQQTDLFVLPSIDENFGVSVVEAMSMSIPVLVTTGVAIADLIEREGAGLIVERNPGSISEAIVRLLGDDGLRRKMGEAGRHLVDTEFAWETRAAEIEKVYLEILRESVESRRMRN